MRYTISEAKNFHWYKQAFRTSNKLTLLITTALIVFYAEPCWTAQASWSAYQQEWRESKKPKKSWTLRVRTGDQGGRWWRRDEGLARLVADQELTIEVMEKAPSEILWRLKDWGPGAHWLLLDRTGEKNFEGEGTPKGEDVQTAIHSIGEKTVWEKREVFLREHPDNGEALEARLATSLILAGYRYRVFVESNQATPFRLGQPGKLLLGPNEIGPAGDHVFGETAETLERLLTLPDGLRLSGSSIFLLGIAFQSFDPAASPRMRYVLQKVRDAALAEWVKSPTGEGTVDSQTLFGPSTLWVSCEWALNDGAIASLPTLVCSPGRIYPQNDLLMFSANEIRDPEALLKFLATVPTEAPEGIVSQAQWKAFLSRQSCLTALYARAYAQLGHWDQAEAALQECWRWSGSRWGKVNLLHEFEKEFTRPTGSSMSAAANEHQGNKDAATPSEKRTILPKDFLDILKSEPGPDLPPPESPLPIRMVLWGNPSWSKEWRELSRTTPLALWGPDELRWGLLTKEDEETMVRLGWHQPHWAAFQGQTTTLAGGDTLPDPRFLALQLGARSKTRLQYLNAFIRQNPDHLDARHDRFELIRSRMPNSVLEPALAEDAAKAWIPLDFDTQSPWFTDRKVWETQASRLMPELEAALYRWPSSRALWHLWISWLPFRPTPLSPYIFALGMAVPRPQGDWLADLPKEVHLAVAAELRKTARFEQMRAWFQCGWDTAVLRKDDSAGNRDTLYGCLAEALSALHQRGPLQELIKQRHGAR